MWAFHPFRSWDYYSFHICMEIVTIPSTYLSFKQKEIPPTSSSAWEKIHWSASCTEDQRALTSLGQSHPVRTLNHLAKSMGLKQDTELIENGIQTTISTNKYIENNTRIQRLSHCTETHTKETFACHFGTIKLSQLTDLCFCTQKYQTNGPNSKLELNADWRYPVFEDNALITSLTT